MTDHPDRLTILEMEYALVNARLNAIDAQLALIAARVEAIESINIAGRFDQVDDALAGTGRTLAEILRRLP